MSAAISAAGQALLEGAIDLHIHAGPALRKRSGDAWDIAEAGERVGMRGALVKDHDRPTVADADMANRRAGVAFEAFSSICLNAPVGGLNPAAVETAVRMGARAIFLPTDSAANDAVFWSHHLEEGGRAHVVGEDPRQWTDQYRVVTEEGELTPGMRDVLQACRAEGATVCTGHLSAREITAVVAACGDLDVPVVVTHAPVFSEASMDELHAWARSGALLELVYVFCCNGLSLPASIRRTVATEAALIEELGADHLVLSTDLGQQGNPPPTDGLAAFASGLLAEGIPESDLDLMMRRNPARALPSVSG